MSLTPNLRIKKRKDGKDGSESSPSSSSDSSDSSLTIKAKGMSLIY